jgi:hypothetical protein
MSPSSIRIVVVFPAPLGPTKPQTEAFGIARFKLSTTLRSPNLFVRPVVMTANSDASVAVTGPSRFAKGALVEM